MIRPTFKFYHTVGIHTYTLEKRKLNSQNYAKKCHSKTLTRENIVCNKYYGYNRSIYKYNLIDVYKYNHIDVFINAFLESFGERKF